MTSIDLPVDIGTNALNYSTPERLQESFLVVIDYLMTSDHSTSDWIDFLSEEECQRYLLLCTATQRLTELESEEFQSNDNTNTNTNTDDDDEDEENQDLTVISALGILAQILIMFADLNEKLFYPLILHPPQNNESTSQRKVKTGAFHFVLLSLKHHLRLHRRDCNNRLQFLLSCVLYSTTALKTEITDEYILCLCALLENTYADVCELTSKTLICVVARARKSKMKHFLSLIQSSVEPDTFRRFTENYFRILNEFDCTDKSEIQVLNLLIVFNTNVFKWNLDEFYFTSDIRVLLDIYIRFFHNLEPYSNSLLLCLDGVFNIIRWPQYANETTLNQYKSEDLEQELLELENIVRSSAQEYEEYDCFRADAEYSKEDISAILESIRNILRKIETIVDTLIAVRNNAYEYPKTAIAMENNNNENGNENNNNNSSDLSQLLIELPIDISEYSFETKSMAQLQQDLNELLIFLSESAYSPAQWIAFLKQRHCEVYQRLILLSHRLLLLEKQYITTMDNRESNNNNHNNEQDIEGEGEGGEVEAANVEEEEERHVSDITVTEVDTEMLFPLSSLSQLVIMFASLNSELFMVNDNVNNNYALIKDILCQNLLNSFSNHFKINVADIVMRLDSILDVILTQERHHFHKSNLVFLDFLMYCGLLTKTEFEPVIISGTKCLFFSISQMFDLQTTTKKKKSHKKSMYAKRESYLLHLQTQLNPDDFRRLTENFFAIINEQELENSNLEMKLLLRFVVIVMEHNLDDFFFSSDLRVLIDIYERHLHNVSEINIDNKPDDDDDDEDASEEKEENQNTNTNVNNVQALMEAKKDKYAFYWLLTAIESLFKWGGYATVLNKYHYSELRLELNNIIVMCNDNQELEVAQEIERVLAL